MACFFDDGLGIAYSYNEALVSSEIVKSTLLKSVFVSDDSKLVWIP